MDLGEPMIFAVSKGPEVCGSEQDYGGNSDAPVMEHYRLVLFHSRSEQNSAGPLDEKASKAHDPFANYCETGKFSMTKTKCCSGGDPAGEGTTTRFAASTAA